MTLLFLTAGTVAFANEVIPEDALLEFLGEFTSYDDDTLAIALEGPLDPPNDSDASKIESGTNRNDHPEQANND